MTVIASPRAGAREWLGLAVLALPTLLLALDITVLNLAIPHLSTDLRPSGSELLWIVDVYGFMIAGFLVTMGTLGDRAGRRRLLLFGAAAFGAASTASAYASSPEMLIAGRTVMGVAGATLMPSTLSLISSLFRDARQRGVAFGVWAAMFSAGIALGPVAGGLLLEHFWWGSVLLLGLPVMLLLLVAGPLLLPEARDPAAGRIDLPSVALSLAAMLPAVYGIKKLATHGPGLATVAALVVGVAAGLLFVRRQRRLATPLLDLTLFARPALRGALLVQFVAIGTVAGVYLFITQYLQVVAGLSPVRAGLWMLPAAAVLVVLSLVAPRLSSRFGAGPVLAAALAVGAAGYLMVSLVGVAGEAGLLIAGFVLVYTGTGPAMALTTDLAVGAAPQERAGAASALSETSSELGGALGIALLGSLGAAVFRSFDVSGDTLTAAAAADRLVATDAFTAGMRVAALASAVLVLVTAVVARRLRDSSAPAPAGS
ncbi:MFS transporter [Actinoplanes aureus]|uniref:MFS transporter n=1 Tax=Actinoplanes aureus TaxID=2792083 RepID=A0A931CCT9_9ACTN|nr:MFS transporter [Actinoplanes aureus]MBG0564788.1 MFS transporter [Actinoplanes aureus]